MIGQLLAGLGRDGSVVKFKNVVMGDATADEFLAPQRNPCTDAVDIAGKFSSQAFTASKQSYGPGSRAVAQRCQGGGEKGEELVVWRAKQIDHNQKSADSFGLASQFVYDSFARQASVCVAQIF